MTAFVLLAALLCGLAVAWLTRPWWAAGSAGERPSAALGVGLALFVLVLAGGGYVGLGSPRHLDSAALAAAAAASASESAEQASPARAGEQIAAMIERLAERLKAQPDDVEGWQMLGRSYAALGQHAEAAQAFTRASQLRPKDATLMVDRAFAMAMANQRSFAGEPAKLIADALAREPNNPKVLALAGTAAYDRKDYAGAVKLWEKLAQAEAPGSRFAEQIQASIAQARQLAGMPPASGTAGPVTAAATTPAASQVSGTVRLAPSLKGRVAPDDTLFVFARAVDGPRMPLAILRLRAKDLPLPFTLDDGMAMSPAARLSGASRVVVGARISKSGNAMPQPGDLQGLAAPAAVGSRGLEIEINEQVAAK